MKRLELKTHGEGAVPPGIGKELRLSTLILIRLTLTRNRSQRRPFKTKKPLKS
jgi:hypothetical protein